MQTTRILKTDEYTSEDVLLAAIQSMVGKIIGDIIVSEITSVQVVMIESAPTGRPYIGMKLENKYKAYVILKGELCQTITQKTSKS